MDSAADVVNRDGIVSVVTWNSIRNLEAYQLLQRSLEFD